jgi:hypothetical protein
MMADYQNGGEALVTSHLDLYRDRFPDAGDDPYWEQFEFSNGLENGENETYVERISNPNYVRLESQFCGLYGWASTYRVLSNAKLKSGRYTTVVGAVQQDVQIATIPLFQFAFFYNGLLEFTVARDLTANGRVHANGDIFLGAAGPVTFNTPVTAAGTIQKRTEWGRTTFGGSGDNTFNGLPDYRTNVACLSLPIGTANTSFNVHKIIEIPEAGEPVDSPMGRERFYNKANMVILIDDYYGTNVVITAELKSSASDPARITIQWTASQPFFLDNGRFKDQREGSWMDTTEVDIDKLGLWINTDVNVAAKFSVVNPLKIVYIADRRASRRTAVRLVNGTELPGSAAGFTIATPNPLYVMGDYNVPFDIRVPAALVSDALTVLSGNWLDSDSTNTVSARVAHSTIINAAIITGNVPSRGLVGDAPFSGGAMNLVRLLENWGGSVLTVNGSFVNLYESTEATGWFLFPPSYYQPPTRQFNFDSSYTNSSKLPPGTPMLSALIRAKWASPPPNTTTYAAE